MDSQVRLYKLLVIVSIFYNLLLLGVIIYFLATKYPSWLGDLFTWLFLTPLILYIINSVFIFFFIKSKYPSNNISNKTEGFLYFFAILTFLSALLSVIYCYIFVEKALEFQNEGNPVTSVLLFGSISLAVATVFAILVSIYSFKFLNLIRKNRVALANQIKNIGTGYE